MFKSQSSNLNIINTLFFLLFSFIFIQYFLVELLNPINHDVAWLMYCAQMLLDGKELYIDLMENNPPLIIYLYTLVVLLSNQLDLSYLLLIKIIITFMTLASSVLTYYFLKKLHYQEDNLSVKLLTLVIALALGPLVFKNFAQREHIIVLLLVPYILLTALKTTDIKVSKTLSVIVSLSAAVAFSIKPHFLIIPIIQITFNFITTKKIQTITNRDNLIIVGGGIIYLVTTYIYTPQYFDFMIPMTLSVYWAYFQPFEVLLFKNNSFYDFSIIIAIASLYRLSTNKTDIIIIHLFIATLGSYVSYLLGGTLWEYHLYPFWCFSLILISYIVINILMQIHRKYSKTQSLSISVTQGLLLITILLFVDFSKTKMLLNTTLSNHKIIEPLNKLTKGPYVLDKSVDIPIFIKSINEFILNNVTETGSFYIFSRFFEPAFPLVNYTNRIWGSRFQVPWILPAVIRHNNGELSSNLTDNNAQKIDLFYKESIVEDLLLFTPEIILVDKYNGNAYFNQPFDYITYLQTYKPFNEAFKNYRLVTLNLPFEKRYSIYRYKTKQPIKS